MIYTGLVNILGEDILFLGVDPDWSRPVNTQMHLPVAVASSVTGVQERRPDASYPQWTLRYQASLDDGDLQQLRSALGARAGRRVAVPFWPDAATPAWSTEGLFDQFTYSYWVFWNEGWADVAFAQTVSAANAAKDHGARLVIGRLRDPEFTALLPSSADVDLSITEDAYPAPPLPLAGGISTWQWEVDWSSAPTQRIVSLQELDRLGRVRRQVDGGEPIEIYTQKCRMDLTRSQVRTFVRFYQTKSGGWVGWDMPSVLTPGTDTTGAPHVFSAANGQMRFSGPVSLEWYTPNDATATFSLEQQVEATGHDEAAPAMAYLYEIRYDGGTEYLTDWADDLVRDGRTWTASRIEHDRIVQSLVPSDDICEIDIWLPESAIIGNVLLTEAETPVEVDIYELMVYPSNSVAELLYNGRVVRSRGTGRRVKISVAPWKGALRRTLPRFQYGHTCNHTLFSPGCASRRPAAMAQSLWVSTGAFAEQTASRQVVLSAPAYGASVPPSPPAQYWAGGWMEVGSGPTRQVRMITASSLSAGLVTLQLARPLRTADITVGDTVTFYPGCDGTFATCRDRFANGDAFGGFPHVPTYIEQAPSGMPRGGK